MPLDLIDIDRWKLARLTPGEFPRLLAQVPLAVLVRTTPEAGLAPSSRRALLQLVHEGLPFVAVDVVNSVGLAEDAKLLSGDARFPQLYACGEFVGGSLVIGESCRSGELHRLLGQNRIQSTDPPELNRSGPESRSFGSAVWAISASPDGSGFASAHADGSVRVWSPQLREPIRGWQANDGWVNCICHSPAGDRVATGSTDAVTRVWDVSTGAELCALRIQRWVNAVEFIDDDTLLSGSADGILRLWSVGRSEEIAATDPGVGAIMSLARVGTQVIIGGATGTTALLRLPALSVECRFPSASRGSVTSVSYSNSLGPLAGFLSGVIVRLSQDSDAAPIGRDAGWAIAANNETIAFATTSRILCVVRRGKKQQVRLPSIATSLLLASEYRVIIGYITGALAIQPLTWE